MKEGKGEWCRAQLGFIRWKSVYLLRQAFKNYDLVLLFMNLSQLHALLKDIQIQELGLRLCQGQDRILA